MYRDAIAVMNTPPDPRSHQTKTFCLAYLIDHRTIQSSLFDLSGRLEVLEQDTFMAKLAVNETVGGKRSAGLSFSDFWLAKLISLIVDANQKVLEFENLLKLWGEVMKAVKTLQDNVKNFGEMLGFVVGGFGTEEEKSLCKKCADKVIDSVQQVFEFETRVSDAKAKVRVIGADKIEAPFKEVVTEP
jgi:hypothetical protein